MANSRRPNMSYCMFENTAAAMEQILDHLREALDEGPEAVQKFMNDLSRYERASWTDLMEQAGELSRLTSEMDAALEQVEQESDCDDSDDGQALASIGWGTDEDYGSAGETL